MKKYLIVLIMTLFAATAHAQTYSKGMAGFGFGNLHACLNSACTGNPGIPEVDTDRGHYFYIVPVAIRKPIQGDIGIRLEPEFSVSKREIAFEYAGEERENIKIDGDDTRYSFGGNLLFDVDMKSFTPYLGAGAGVEYSKLTASMNGNQISTHDDFARYWKVIAGIEVPIMGNVKGNVEYNYRATDRFADNDSPLNWNLNDNHIINAGISIYW